MVNKYFQKHSREKNSDGPRLARRSLNMQEARRDDDLNGSFFVAFSAGCEIGPIVRPHKLNESRFGWSADDDVTQRGALR